MRCKECGTTEAPHCSGGRCRPCVNRLESARNGRTRFQKWFSDPDKRANFYRRRTRQRLKKKWELWLLNQKFLKAIGEDAELEFEANEHRIRGLFQRQDTKEIIQEQRRQDAREEARKARKAREEPRNLSDSGGKAKPAS